MSPHLETAAHFFPATAAAALSPCSEQVAQHLLSSCTCLVQFPQQAADKPKFPAESEGLAECIDGSTF